MIAWTLLQALSKDKLSVFLFHKVPIRLDPLVPGDMDLVSFERILDRIVSQFRVLPLDDAICRLPTGKLPRRAACITFDDGYSDWESGAVPALMRRNLHATFFITTGQFFGKPLWHERIQAAVRQMPGEILNLGLPSLPPQPMASLVQRQSLVVKLENELKYLTLKRREEVLLQLEAMAAVQLNALPVMTPEALRDLHSKGFGIGAHTAVHPILDYCNAEEVKQEIGGAREILRAMAVGEVNGFAYPNGRPYADFSRLHVDAVKRAGYRYAVTTHWGVANPLTSAFQIPRFTPWAKREWHALYQMGRNLMTNPLQVPEVIT
jgi:peptidoglycan/xylan/chitin deacetylase (PgdA/CDA1 family)